MRQKWHLSSSGRDRSLGQFGPTQECQAKQVTRLNGRSLASCSQFGLPSLTPPSNTGAFALFPPIACTAILGPKLGGGEVAGAEPQKAGVLELEEFELGIPGGFHAQR